MGDGVSVGSRTLSWICPEGLFFICSAIRFVLLSLFLVLFFSDTLRYFAAESLGIRSFRYLIAVDTKNGEKNYI